MNMNTKTIEGLVGARANVELMNTPVRIFEEAEGRGDTATMERAMGYANKMADEAEEYKSKAHKGMEEDAKDAKEKAQSDTEKVIQKRREEREKLEEKIDKDRKTGDGNYGDKGELVPVDTVEISQEGKSSVSSLGSGGADTADVVYTRTGEAVSVGEDGGDLLDVEA